MWPIKLQVILVSVAWSIYKYCYFPGWHACPLQVTPQEFCRLPLTDRLWTHFYSKVERGILRSKCLIEERNCTQTQLGLEPEPFDPVLSVLTVAPLRLHIIYHMRSVLHCRTRWFYHSLTIVAVYGMDVVPQRKTTSISYRDVLWASLNVGKLKRASCISCFHGPAYRHAEAIKTVR